MNFTTEEVWEKLRCHRVQIVQELRVDRALLFDYLRSKTVFDNEDCEIVQAEKTNERKASKLLDILQTKSTEGLQHFLDVLQLLNPGLYEKLTGQKATASANSTVNEVSYKSLSDIDSPCDLNVLGNQLIRAVADLREMITTLGHDHLLREQYAALLMKLLSKEQEANELRKQVEEERKRNEELKLELKELSVRVQRHSMRISEAIALLTERYSHAQKEKYKPVRKKPRSYVIDDGVIPMRRPRAYDLDRSKIFYKTTFWASRRIP